MHTQAASSGVGLLLNYVCYIVILAWYFCHIVLDIVDIYRSLTAGNKNIVAEVSVLARNCLRGVHNEIHNIQKPCEALPSQVFLEVIQGQRAAKGHILFLYQSTKGILKFQWAQYP